MDGNGRWARAKGQPTIAGHRAGAEAARRITERAAQVGVRYLTLFAFSSENWLRSKSWIDELMGLLRWYFKHELQSLIANGIQVKVIGQRELLPLDVQDIINKTEVATADNSTITLILALSYGSRDEITHAMKQIAFKVAAGEIAPQDINHDVISLHLYTVGIPDPDLLIRTSGEQRLSNYLLWQMAYTEFVFLPTLWPDFGAADFDQAIQIFQTRQRRYGI